MFGRVAHVLFGFGAVVVFGGLGVLVIGKNRGEVGWLGRLMERGGQSVEAAADVERFVPVLQGQSFLDRLKVVEGRGRPYVGEVLAGDVWAVYGVHEVEGIWLIDESTVKAMGLSAGQMREKAVANLRRLAGEVEFVGDGPLFGVAADIFAASLMLVDEIWDAAAGMVEGELVAAAATRDVVLFTGSGSEEGLRQLRFDARSVFEEASWAISDTLLVWRGGRWDVWDPVWAGE